MKLAAKVNLYVNAEGNPSVQFEPENEFLEMSPLKQALFAHAAVQIGTMVVKGIMEKNPEHVQEMCEHIAASTLDAGMPRPN